MNLASARQRASQYGDRILRESSVIRAASEVWSDVASTHGHGFRSGQAGPLLHGELPSGAVFQLTIVETDAEGEYRTLAKIHGKAGAANLDIRPHDVMSRALGFARKRPAGLDETFTARFSIKGPSAETLSPCVVETLLDLADRSPNLYGDGESVTLILEGVELVHTRIEAIIALLDALAGGKPKGDGPFR
jgi:hypothetical protein